MLWQTSLLAAPIAVALLAGPAAFAVTNLNQPDGSDIYLVLGERTDSDADNLLKEIGPRNSWLARMIHAPPDIHRQLVSLGYWTLPASRIAGICGVDPI